jgi:hypothetical protein
VNDRNDEWKEEQLPHWAGTFGSKFTTRDIYPEMQSQESLSSELWGKDEGSKRLE